MKEQVKFELWKEMMKLDKKNDCVPTKPTSRNILANIDEQLEIISSSMNSSYATPLPKRELQREDSF